VIITPHARDRFALLTGNSARNRVIEESLHTGRQVTRDEAASILGYPLKRRHGDFWYRLAGEQTGVWVGKVQGRSVIVLTYLVSSLQPEQVEQELEELLTAA
jgi:hypothetical protein